MKGSAEFDASTGNYRITGSGSESGARRISSTMSGARSQATLRSQPRSKFLTEGNDHRKGGIMLRQSTDTDSPYCDLVIHGNGMPAVQFRNSRGDNTNTVDFPIEGPGTFRLKLVRQGATITVSVGRNGEALKNWDIPPANWEILCWSDWQSARMHRAL